MSIVLIDIISWKNVILIFGTKHSIVLTFGMEFDIPEKNWE